MGHINPSPVQSGTYVGPSLIVPPAGISASLATGVANQALFVRPVSVPVARNYRYVNLRIGVQSGNIQVGAVLLTGARLANFTRVLSSGIIACPAAGNVSVDCGSTAFVAGEYALFVWVDNAVATFGQTSLGNSAIGLRGVADSIGAIPGGVAASGTPGFGWVGTIAPALSLEADD